VQTEATINKVRRYLNRNMWRLCLCLYNMFRELW